MNVFSSSSFGLLGHKTRQDKTEFNPNSGTTERTEEEFVSGILGTTNERERERERERKNE